MRAMRLGLIGFVAFLSLQAGAQAQDAETPCSMNMIGVRTYGVSSNSKSQPLPFTAKVKLTLDQQLAEGNRVHGVRYTQLARDSAGKVRNEMSSGCYQDDEGKMKQRLSITITHQAERSYLSWQEQMPEMEKIAHLQYFPAPSPSKKMTPEEIAAMQKRAAMQQSNRNEFKNEDLGTRNFYGVEAHGRRMTRTIPPGAEGNELALKIVDEEWRSNELGLMMLAIHNDPRTGISTWEVEELDREEPNAALFSPPEG
jgi:hypothetical protein